MSFVVAALSGALFWTFLEYVLHRFDGHGMRGRTRFSREHLRHHADPRYFAPTSSKLLLAIPFVGATGAVALPLFGAPGAVFTAAFGLTYAGYEVLHRRLHTHPPRNAYGRWARRHHFAHHYLSPDANHGVTTPLWDLVFGTRVQPEGALRVPPKQVPVWLTDPATGNVHAALAADYEVPVRRRPA